MRRLNDFFSGDFNKKEDGTVKSSLVGYKTI